MQVVVSKDIKPSTKSFLKTTNNKSVKNVTVTIYKEAE